MTSRSSQRVVYVAIATNLAVMVSKYAAAVVTGSSAMLAEAFHSTADAGNELLLLLGMKRSARPADALHPFGHGKALYFYSLLVAVYIFGVGGVLALYNGITRLKHPQFSSHVGWSYAVLALAAIFDFYSWRISYRELLARKGPDDSTWQEIIGSKVPTVFTVFLEDSAGLIGTFLAFLGIFLGRMLHNPYFDPIASITIGFLLAAVAILLGRESGALLLGERTNRARVRRLRQIIVADSSVEEAGELLTMQMGTDQVLLTAGIRFRRDLTVETLELAIARLETHIRLKEPTIKKVFLEPDSLSGLAHEPRQNKYR